MKPEPQAINPGLTGIIARVLGISPWLASALKYAALAAAIFGAVKLWEHRVATGAVEDASKDARIETQQSVIETQSDAARNQTADNKARDDHITKSAASELAAQEDLMRRQALQIAKLETLNEELSILAASRPCLRDPWPDSLQSQGGFDLNRYNTEPGGPAGAAGRGDPDAADLHGANRKDPGG